MRDDYFRTGGTIDGVRTRIPYRLSAKQHYGILKRYNPGTTNGRPRDRTAKRVSFARLGAVRVPPPHHHGPIPLLNAFQDFLEYQDYYSPPGSPMSVSDASMGSRSRASSISSVASGHGGGPPEPPAAPVIHQYFDAQPDGTYLLDRVFEGGIRGMKPSDAAKTAIWYRDAKNSVRDSGFTGFTVPGTNYIGPLNPLLNGKPVDAGDVKALAHDHEYAEEIKRFGQVDTYSKWNGADQRTYDQISSIPVAERTKGEHIVQTFLNSKRLIRPWNVASLDAYYLHK